MADCAYSFKGIDGTLQTVTGIPALKAYLVDGGLEQLFPERKFPLKAVARVARAEPEPAATQPNRFRNIVEAESAAENLFGPGIKNLTANGVLNFTQGYAAWPEAAQSQLQGGEEAVYYGGKIYVNLQATSKSRLAPVLLHEIGEHFNLELVLGVPGYKSLQDQITNRAKIVGSQAEKVWNQVAKLYPDLKVGSKEFVAEVIAKLGEIAPNAPWFRRILAKLKAFLIQRGLGRGFITGTLTENDMHDLLIASLRSAAKGFTKGEARLYGSELQASVPGWHGTPHEVDRFSTSKIGTGEGAQAFGYGLYFTSAKRIAEYYRDKLTEGAYALVDRQGNKVDYRFKNAQQSIKDEVLHLLARNENHADAIEEAQDSTYGGYFKDAIIAELKAMRDNGVFAKYLEGRLYQVELAPEQDEFLDWVKPLSEQSEKVKDLIKLVAEEEGLPVQYKRKTYFSEKTGNDFYDAVATVVGSPKSASAILHSYGIRGVTYKAEGGKSDETNYVVFHEDDVNIVGRFSRPIPNIEPAPEERSMLWNRWFGKSKMQRGGEPIKFYHGSQAEFTVFDKSKLATNTTHTTAGLGHFFTENPMEAKRYGGDVKEVFLSVQNPYITTSWALDDKFKDAAGAAKFREKLKEQGYDGVYIKDAKYAIVFESNQAKLTDNNAPTFADDVRFSRTEKDEQFEKMGTVQDGETYEEAFWRDNNPSMMEILREKLEEATDKTKKILLAGLGVNHMIEIMANSMPGLKDLGKAIQARETAKMDIIREADNIVVDAKEKLTAPVRAKLNRAINESTDSDIDASLDWVGVEQPPTAGAPIFRAYSQARFTDYYKGLADQAAKALGARDGFKRNKAAFKDEAKAQEFVRTLADIEAKQSTNQNNGKLTKENQSRKAEHDKWNPMLTGLGKEAASLYRQMNDQHTRVMEDQLGEIIRRIEDAIADHRLRSQMIANVRLAFEDNSLQWYYAPLTRFGDYWYYGKDKDGKEWREHFTSEKALSRTIQRFEKMGGEILGRGKALQNIEKFGSVGAADSYVADIQKRISDALDPNDPVTQSLQDSIYQFHLSTLPDVSIRHSRQHRKGVKGAETDAFKSFSDKMHHASTQLANMKYGADIAEVMSDHQEMKKLWENKRYLREAEAKVGAIEFLMDDWDTMAKPKVLERALKQAEADGDAAKVDLYKQAISVRNKFGGALRDQLNTQGEVVGQMGGTSSDVQDGLERLYARTKRQAEGARKVMPKDQVLASDVIDELLKSVDAMMKTQTTDMDQLAMKASALNFTGMMGFGISSALVNIVQTPGVAAPVIGARYGMAKTLATMNKTASWFLKAMFNNMKDEDGNYSITEYLFAEQQKAEKTGDKAKVAELNGVISALRQFKTDGTIGRTQTFDLLGVAENGLGTSSVFFDIAKKGGFMFHHAERFNREVTLAAAYLLSQNDTQRNPKKEGESDAAYKARLHESAVDYAHWANERSHLNYSAEVAARIFRGPLARISMQFRKYTHGMLFLWAKSAHDMLKPVKEENYPDKATFEAALEAKLEARRTLFGLLFMQTSFAGVMGLPMMGALGVVYGILAGDDDDIPADMERDLTAILIKWFGEDVGYAMARGAIDKATPMALSSRLDLKDAFFREPLKADELEGGEEVAAYALQILGPTGGSAVKAGDAIGYLAKGELLKGTEKLLPKAIGDILKAYRLSTEGATTRQGDKIKDMKAMEVFLQGLGFGSSELNRFYTKSGFAKAADASIGSARQSITSTQGRKMAAGDEIDMDRVDEWNEAHPEWPIHYADLVASAKRVSKNRETREEKGYLLNPKLEYLREEYDFFSDEDED